MDFKIYIYRERENMDMSYLVHESFQLKPDGCFEKSFCSSKNQKMSFSNTRNNETRQ